MLQMVGMKNILYADTLILMQLFFMKQIISTAYLASW